MMPDWPQTKLRQISKIFSGYAFRSQDLGGQGIPVLKIANIQNKRVSPDCPDHFPEELCTNKLKQFFLHPDDTLIAMTGAGSVGKVGKMAPNSGRFLVNQRVAIVRPDSSQCNPNFVYFALSQDDYEKRLYSLGVGAGQPNVSPKQIGELELPFPPLGLQRRIANILSAYEDLIENSRRRITILDEIASALYRDWFIHFRFPGLENERLVASPLGDIPDGWEVRKVAEFAEFVRGIEPGSDAYCSEEAPGRIKFLRVGDFSKRDSSTFIPVDLAEGRILNVDDIGITLDGSVGIVRIGLQGAYSSGIRKVLVRDPERLGWSFAYRLLKSDSIQGTIQAHARGTTIKHAGSAVSALEFVAPPASVVDRFEQTTAPMLREVLILEEKNRILRQTRDLLLPYLMSGRMELTAD